MTDSFEAGCIAKFSVPRPYTKSFDVIKEITATKVPTISQKILSFIKKTHQRYLDRERKRQSKEETERRKRKSKNEVRKKQI
ncbi:MAG: hypothetical protein WB587_09500, partial [Nitrososphaeraceae archaeon]